MAARIQVAREARRGDLIEVRIVIQHPMETGFRYDSEILRARRAVGRHRVPLGRSGKRFRIRERPGDGERMT